MAEIPDSGESMSKVECAQGETDLSEELLRETSESMKVREVEEACVVSPISKGDKQLETHGKYRSCSNVMAGNENVAELISFEATRSLGSSYNIKMDKIRVIVKSTRIIDDWIYITVEVFSVLYVSTPGFDILLYFRLQQLMAI